MYKVFMDYLAYGMGQKKGSNHEIQKERNWCSPPDDKGMTVI